jgi:hypothetical protein
VVVNVDREHLGPVWRADRDIRVHRLSRPQLSKSSHGRQAPLLYGHETGSAAPRNQRLLRGAASNRLRNRIVADSRKGRLL